MDLLFIVMSMSIAPSEINFPCVKKKRKKKKKKKISFKFKFLILSKTG